MPVGEVSKADLLNRVQGVIRDNLAKAYRLLEPEVIFTKIEEEEGLAWKIEGKVRVPLEFDFEEPAPPLFMEYERQREWEEARARRKEEEQWLPFKCEFDPTSGNLKIRGSVRVPLFPMIVPFGFGPTYTQRTPNDQRSDMLNPNNTEHAAAVNNRANQMNPNNSAYHRSRGRR